MSALLIPGLTALRCTIAGNWTTKWNRSVWEGVAHCEAPFVILLLGALGGVSYWAKSLPSDPQNEIPISFDPLPNRGALFQLFFRAGRGAWLSEFVVELPDDRRADVRERIELTTGALGCFLPSTSPALPELMLLCLAKQDVIVRRNHVWGLRPRLLDEAPPLWRPILARGRCGVAPADLTAPAALPAR